MTAHTHAFSHWPFDDAVETLTYCTEGVAQRPLPMQAKRSGTGSRC